VSLCSSLPSCAEDPADQLVKAYPGRVRGLRQQARLGQAGNRVRLEHVQLLGLALGARTILPPDLAAEAAADLGATPWRQFRKVVLPLAMPGVVAGI